MFLRFNVSFGFGKDPDHDTVPMIDETSASLERAEDTTRLGFQPNPTRDPWEDRKEGHAITHHLR